MKNKESNNSVPVSITGGYRSYTVHKRAVILILSFSVLILTILCLNAGSSGMNPLKVTKALFGSGDATDIIIVRNIRLPRVIAAILAGAGLAVAGCVMQIVLDNPMASPSTLGVSNAAVFGANFAIIILGAGRFNATDGETLTVNNPYIVTVCAFVCALISVVFILTLYGRRGFSAEAVVLSGIAIGSLFSAGTTIIQYMSTATEVSAAVFWTFGDLGRASYREDLIMLVVISVSMIYFFMKRWDYNAIASGDETAVSLGVKTGRVRFISLLLASMICAVTVSFLGIIGFVGLIAPQFVKRFIGADYRFMLPASALAGVCLVLFSDTAARSVMSGISLPVGAVIPLLGAPVFLWMLLRKKGGRRI